MGVFYRKYRPKKFRDVIGHDAVKVLLQKAISNQAPSHAYLFSGSRGVGKTTMARLIACSVNCENREKIDDGGLKGFEKGDPCGKCNACKSISIGNFPDVIEIDAASNRGIDEIRELRAKVAFPPMQGKYKVYIVDEAHMLTREAFNALLKTLEEPPSHVIFILCTTEQHKLPDTIISRCQWFELHLANPGQLVEKLCTIAKGEGVKVDEDVYRLVARVARGSFRDGESLFESLVGVVKKGKKVTVEDARKILNIPSKILVKRLFNVVASYETVDAIKQLKKLESRGFGAERLIDELIEVGRNELVESLGTDRGKRVANVINGFVKAKRDMPLFPDPYVSIELAVVCGEGSGTGGSTGSGGCGESKKGGGNDYNPVKPQKKSQPKANSPMAKAVKVEKDVVSNDMGDNEIWNKVLSEIGRSNYQLASILERSRPEFVSGDEIVVYVGNEFEEGVLSTPKTKKLLRDKVTQACGNTVKLRCEVVRSGDKKVIDVKAEDLDSIFDGEIK